MFAVTRSLDEAEQALERHDETTIWGVGCHPGLVGAQKGFDSRRFRALVATTPYAGELGLDGASRVPLEKQQLTLASALGVLQLSPRITSLHSYRATGELLDVIARCPQPGLVLHWWLGTDSETDRALELGCYFSVNPSSVRRRDLLARIPLDRVLPETDHPFGDRGRGLRRPGHVAQVEMALASVHDLSIEAIRRRTWQTLADIVKATNTRGLFPSVVRREIELG